VRINARNVSIDISVESRTTTMADSRRPFGLGDLISR
jgi:hypothetical protein